jgi:mitochondrial fission protein ELM1
MQNSGFKGRGTAFMTTLKTVWLLLDDRAGNVNQCLGVVEALGYPFVRKDIKYNAIGRLPNFLLGATMYGVDASSRAGLCQPWPDLVIAAGRRTAPVARYIKRQSQGKTRLVQIMDPGSTGAAEFDLICVPAHDDKQHVAANEMVMFGAPHRVTQEQLNQAQAQWCEQFAGLPQPRIGLIVGGATKDRDFNSDMAERLAAQVNKMAAAQGGSVLVTTSRRTGAATQTLMAGITVPSFKYQWGDDGTNPYFGILACSDILVVTGDSVSMCSECCGTAKPVYIFAPKDMISDKHSRMVDALVTQGYAHYLRNDLQEGTGRQLNAAHDIATRIKQLFENNA